MSPDYTSDDDGPPDAVPYADLSDPQSLNLYAYVQNNPLIRFDSEGHDCVNGRRVAHPYPNSQSGCPTLPSFGMVGRNNASPVFAFVLFPPNSKGGEAGTPPRAPSIRLRLPSR